MTVREKLLVSSKCTIFVYLHRLAHNPSPYFFSYSANLTWRDVQHIIVNSARRSQGGIPLSHGRYGEWVKNKAGLYVSKFYGFGLMNVASMVNLAKNWKRVPEQIKCEIKGDKRSM